MLSASPLREQGSPRRRAGSHKPLPTQQECKSPTEAGESKEMETSVSPNDNQDNRSKFPATYCVQCNTVKDFPPVTQNCGTKRTTLVFYWRGSFAEVCH